MKKIVSLLLCALLMVTVVSGAARPVMATSSQTSAQTSSRVSANTTPFRLSCISDVTGSDGTRTYLMYAPYTDTYTLSSVNTDAITISRDGKELAKGSSSVQAALVENEVYTLTVKTPKGNAGFTMQTTAKNHLITLPYDVADPVDASSFPLTGDGDPLTPAEIHYQKRSGGTYIYSNNPEAIYADAVGKALIRSEGLTGDVYVTFEHANYSGMNIYLGYQLKNDGDSDVYVTVTNVGYQTTGTWLGQRAWYDFYNMSFTLEETYDSIADNQAYYGFQKEYTPRVFQPVTYRLPAGEYFYVIGGTTQDAYRHINVDNSANQMLRGVTCANGNVKFTVTGGSVTGTMYAYKTASQVQAEPASLGYVAGEYGRQYSGRADHAGVIDNYATWTFSDETADGALPVTYTNRYDAGRPADTTPYKAYNSTEHTVNAKSWVTHLNPQNDHAAVGTDMVAFVYYDQNGKKLVMDNDCADGVGKPGNFGNWMIEYQDHFTLVNQGDKPRSVTFTTQDSGSLAMLARDSATGKVLRADLTAGLFLTESNYAYTVVIPPHSVKQITLDYVLLACSYGRVVHAASLGQYTGSTTVSGDVNGDWNVDSVDYLLLKRHVLGTFKLTGAQQAVADVNGDGQINALDYMLVKRHVLGSYKIA